jgi:hypothetical protein
MTKKKGQDAGISKVRRYLVPLALLLLVIGASVSLFVYRDTVSDLGNWGYLGAFLIGLAANATVIFPMPGLLILFTLGPRSIRSSSVWPGRRAGPSGR